MDNIKEKSDLLQGAMVKNVELKERLKKTQELELGVRRENTKLKEFLKDCKEILFIEEMVAGNPRYIDELRILIKRIKQALGES